MTNTNTTDLQSLMKGYDIKPLRYMYYDKALDSKGVTYSTYAKMYFNSIYDKDTNKKDIKDLYKIEGWYLLWYLMTEAHQTYYIKTTINMILNDVPINTYLTAPKIKSILLHLQKQNTILIDKNKFTYNEPIQITIAYNNENIYQPNKLGYRALPIEIVKTILRHVNCNQWAIYSVMVCWYSYYNVKENIKTGNREFYINGYSFPTQEELSQILGLDRRTIRKELEGEVYTDEKGNEKIKGGFDEEILKVLPYEMNPYQYIAEDGKRKVKNTNKRYLVPLMQRVEYVYYHIHNIEIKRSKDITNKIKKIGFDVYAINENYNDLRDKDYVDSRFINVFKEYEKALRNNDIELYKNIRKDYKIEESKN